MKNEPDNKKYFAIAIFLTLTVFFSIFFGNINKSEAATEVVGERKVFFLEKNYDRLKRESASFILKNVGINSYVYVDEQYYNGISFQEQQLISPKLEEYMNEFDNVIYPGLTSFWGEFTKANIGNSPLTIAFLDMIDNAAGYYNNGDFIGVDLNPKSNNRNIIYININMLGNPRLKYFIAHEFQHLITSANKEVIINKWEDVWVNEMLAEFSATILGYNNNNQDSILRKRAEEFMRVQMEPLLEWKNKFSDYSAISLFAEYLYERFGFDFFKNIMNGENIGIQGVNDAIKITGSAENFRDIFSDWLVLLYYNNPAMGDYYYKNRQLSGIQLPLTQSIVPEKNRAVTIAGESKDWTQNYYYFKGRESGELTLSFVSQNYNGFGAVYVVEKKNGKKEIGIKYFYKGPETLNISDFGDSADGVLVAPFFSAKTSDFTEDDPTYSFSVIAELKNSAVPGLLPAEKIINVPPLKEGSLIRARSDYKVYIINGSGYKRHILNPAVFNSYEHFKWADVIEVDALTANQYKNSYLIKRAGFDKVYELNGDMSKHWVDLSEDSFILSGRKWESIFIINELEASLYKDGVAIK